MGVETSTAARTAVLPLVGRLDGEAGLRLLDAARGALEAGAARLDVDLCEVTAFTAAGTAALLACRDLPARIRDGAAVEVHYRTSRGPGRDALLAAFAEVRDDLNDGELDEPTIDLREP